MKGRIVAAIAVVLGLGAASAQGADPQPAPATPGQEQPFGWQMMTPDERAAHCDAMRAAQTPEQREQLRAAHHAQMVARAVQRGTTLPEQPMGMGPGAGCQGMGMGMGPGAGMGPGMGGPMGGPGMGGGPPPAQPAPKP